MGLMDRLNQAKCATGLHAGDWLWLAEGNCAQSRTCTRCGNVGNRDHHNVTKWAFAGDQASPCLMERHCERCQDGETRLEHAPQFTYQDEMRVEGQSAARVAFTVFANGLTGGRCRGQDICMRCGYTDGKVSERHVWGDLYKADEYTTRWQRDCLRCGRVDKSMF
jgi:hypothetical protein